MIEAKGVDVGGVFNFIRNKPPDSEHTKEVKLWKSRFQNGMCPHCGQKLFKVKRIRFRRKFIPLERPGMVENGVCVHPRCDPPLKSPCQVTFRDGGDGDDGTVATVSNDVDTALDAIAEHRADMEKYYGMMTDANEKAREEAAIMLEDTIMQLNRAMAELSSNEKEELGLIKRELLEEIDTARDGLHSLQNRVDHLEEATKSLRRQVVNLRDESQHGHSLLQEQLKELRLGLDEVRSGSDLDRSSWSIELQSLREENSALREKVGSLQKQLSTALVRNDALALQLEQLQPGSSSSNREEPPLKPYVAQADGVPRENSWSTSSKSSSLLRSLPHMIKYKLNQSLNGYSDAIKCCAVLDNGHRLACGSYKTLYIWRLQFGEGTYVAPQKLVKHSDRITCCSSARDREKTLITGSDDGTIVVWTQKKNGEFEYCETLTKHHGNVSCCSISSDGRTLVSGGQDESIIVWKCSVRVNGRRKFEPEQIIPDAHPQGVECCQMAADGSMFLSGGSDDTVKIWEVGAFNKFACKEILRKHTDAVLSCRMDESGNTIVSGGKDDTLVVWKRGGDGKFAYHHSLNEHTDWINCCIFVGDGEIIASASDDNTLRVWMVQPDGKYECTQVLKKHGNYVYCCAALDDGETLVSGGNDNTLKQWKLKSRGPP